MAQTTTSFHCRGEYNEQQKEFDAFAEDSVIGDLQMQSDTSWLTKLVQEEQSRLGQQ